MTKKQVGRKKIDDGKKLLSAEDKRLKTRENYEDNGNVTDDEDSCSTVGELPEVTNDEDSCSTAGEEPEVNKNKRRKKKAEKNDLDNGDISDVSGIAEDEKFYIKEGNNVTKRKGASVPDGSVKKQCHTYDQIQQGEMIYTPESVSLGDVKCKNLNRHSTRFVGNEGKNILCCILFIAILAIVYVVIQNLDIQKSENIGKPETLHNRNRLDKSLSQIQKEFPKQSETLWNSLYSGINYVNISNPTRPGIFVLLHNSNQYTAECLAYKVAKASSAFLGTEGVIEIIGKHQMKEGYDNEFIGKYKDSLRNKGVMVVFRLDQIPGDIAKSFHSFCDSINPLVARSVILFTLDESNLIENKDMKPGRKAQELLKHLWKETLIDSTLNALITRLTETVLQVAPDHPHKCP